MKKTLFIFFITFFLSFNIANASNAALSLSSKLMSNASYFQKLSLRLNPSGIKTFSSFPTHSFHSFSNSKQQNLNLYEDVNLKSGKPKIRNYSSDKSIQANQKISLLSHEDLMKSMLIIPIKKFKNSEELDQLLNILTRLALQNNKLMAYSFVGNDLFHDPETLYIRFDYNYYPLSENFNSNVLKYHSDLEFDDLELENFDSIIQVINLESDQLDFHYLERIYQKQLSIPRFEEPVLKAIRVHEKSLYLQMISIPECEDLISYFFVLKYLNKKQHQLVRVVSGSSFSFLFLTSCIETFQKDVMTVMQEIDKKSQFKQGRLDKGLKDDSFFDDDTFLDYFNFSKGLSSERKKIDQNLNDDSQTFIESEKKSLDSQLDLSASPSTKSLNPNISLDSENAVDSVDSDDASDHDGDS